MAHVCILSITCPQPGMCEMLSLPFSHKHSQWKHHFECYGIFLFDVLLLPVKGQEGSVTVLKRNSVKIYLAGIDLFDF